MVVIILDFFLTAGESGWHKIGCSLVMVMLKVKSIGYFLFILR